MIGRMADVAIGWHLSAPLGQQQVEGLGVTIRDVLASGKPGVARIDATEAGWESAKQVCMFVLAGELGVAECKVAIKQNMLPHWEQFRLKGWWRDGGHIEFRRVQALPGSGVSGD